MEVVGSCAPHRPGEAQVMPNLGQGRTQETRGAITNQHGAKGGNSSTYKNTLQRNVKAGKTYSYLLTVCFILFEKQLFKQKY